MSGSRKARILAWTLGLSGALACVIALGWAIAVGLYVPIAITNLTLIALGLIGALVASRAPTNSVGWLMCAGSLTGSLVFLPLDYGYTAGVLQHGSWPLAPTALWLATWLNAPSLGLLVPLITVRFPDGRVLPRWRVVNWLAVVGTAAYAVSVALAPKSVSTGFLPMGSAGPFRSASAIIENPLGSTVPQWMLDSVRLVALALVVLAYVACVASVIDRFRQARGDERLQLKWFTYSGVLMVAALVLGIAGQIISAGVTQLIHGMHLGDALIPLSYATLSLPVALGIAILRYRLYEIDVIINRTLVYGSLTAVLGAVYAAVITLLNRLFISVSGQKSDAAYVVTAFVVVVAASPVKDWLQRQVDRRVVHWNATVLLNEFTSEVEAVVSVMDAHRIAIRLVDQAVVAFDARGGALFLNSTDRSRPVYTRGRLDGDADIEVSLRHEDKQLGRLVLGGRRGDITYTQRDREALQRSADSVSEALAIAEHLGLRSMRGSLRT